jgi:hypothetical protein
MIEGGLMKTRNTITKLIILTMTMAALGGLLQPVHAQTGDGSVRFISYTSLGVVHGEKVRLSVANPKESTGSLTFSFSYYLAHGSNASSSVPLFESEWIKVPAKELRFVDVSREELNTEGEPEMARAQVLVKLTMIAPAGSDADDFPASLEIIEDEIQDGGTVKTDSKYRLILLAAQRSKQMNAPIGFNPGEKLRYTFYYPKEEGDRPVSVTTYTYDSIGNVAKQTDPVVLRPGDVQAVDINYDDLPLLGEVRGRVQVRPSIQVVLMDGSVRHVKLSVSMELVDPSGRTIGQNYGDYYTGTVSVSGDGF